MIIAFALMAIISFCIAMVNYLEDKNEPALVALIFGFIFILGLGITHELKY